MADSKITALTALTTADPATDMFPVVDVSDTTMAASGTTKRISINNILACSPTATLASATITGDLTVDTNTLFVDAANNRVGIGTASPAYTAHVRTTSPILAIQDDASAATGVGGTFNFLGYTSGTSGANIFAQIKGVKTAGSAGGEYQVFTSDSAGNSVQRYLIDSTGVSTWSVGGSTAMTLNSTGLGVGVTPAGTGGCLQLKSGITFPATQVASSDANTLDDYEEGTFTPTISGTTSAGTGTYTTQFGRYTKVGRVVTCDITITWTAHTGTGNLEIDGLPFSVLTTTNYTASAAIGYFDNVALTAGNVPAFSMLWFNTTKLRGYQYPTGGGGVTSIPMDSAGQMSLSITYIVA